MEVSITSRETIKPSSLSSHLTKPFKISLLDQNTPSTYVPTIFFYTLKNKRTDANTFAYENVWFGQSGDFRTERFVFDAEALATLKARARSELVENPSRVQALSGFIWKSAMEASRKASTKQTTSPITHVMAQAVNIRRRREEQQPGTAIGNVLWWAIAIHYDDCSENELAGLVELVNESLIEVNSDYMKSLEGEEGLELVTQHLKQIEEIYANEDPEIFGFTSWVNAGFKDIDFGWGKPTWQGMFEKVGSASRNLIFLIDTMDGRGIEAWTTLDERVLANLKNDPEFFAFASVNPPVPVTSRLCL